MHQLQELCFRQRPLWLSSAGNCMQRTREHISSFLFSKTASSFSGGFISSTVFPVVPGVRWHVAIRDFQAIFRVIFPMCSKFAHPLMWLVQRHSDFPKGKVSYSVKMICSGVRHVLSLQKVSWGRTVSHSPLVWCTELLFFCLCCFPASFLFTALVWVIYVIPKTWCITVSQYHLS